MEAKTNFRLSTSENEVIFEIVITGEVTKDTVDELHHEVMKLLQGKSIQALLIDVGAVPTRQEALAAAFFRVRSLPVDIVKIPTAVVDPNYDASYTSFYETTAANVGQSAKWFTDIEAARTWLMSRLKTD